MIDFKSIRCGVVKNAGKENEEKFLFIAEDKEGNEYSMSCKEPLTLITKDKYAESYINLNQNEFLSQAFIYLCKEMFPKPIEVILPKLPKS